MECLRNRGNSELLIAEEVELLLLHAERNAPTLYPMIATAVYAGMRKGELYGLRWSDVNITAATLRIAYSYGALLKAGNHVSFRFIRCSFPSFLSSERSVR